MSKHDPSPQPESKSGDKYKLQILSRALSVLFAFSSHRPDLTLNDLSVELSLNKASLLRILRTLEAEHFLLRSGDHYRLGPRVLELSNVYLNTLSVHRVAQSSMTALARQCGQTVSLAVLEDLEVVYIAIEHPQREVGILGEIGGRHPAHATALGKVMLADLGEEELHQLLDGKELVRLTHRTITNPDQLIEHLAHTRKQGYAVDDEERGIGIRCVAVPIRDFKGSVVAAMSLAGPIFHMTEDALPHYKERLLETADDLSRQLGFQGRCLSEPH
jgi:DNA-binding IclR family transcriptional regulator